MKLTKEDISLIDSARQFPSRQKVPGGIVREVGCALINARGEIFTGTSMHLCCGLGFCAEHSAISNMVSHSKETEIKTIVALWVDGKNFGIMYPCGRCRELMQQIHRNNRAKTMVIISDKEKVKLSELLPGE